MYYNPTPPHVFTKKLCSYVVDGVKLLIVCGISKVHKNIYRYLIKYILFFEINKLFLHCIKIAIVERESSDTY